MANCSDDIISLIPSCDTLKTKGGVQKKVWVAPHDSELVTYTLDGDGYIDSATLATTSPAQTLKVFSGKKLKNNGAITGEVGDNASTLNQDLNLELWAETPEEREAVEKLFYAEEVDVFVQRTSGAIELWGYNTGLKASALTGGTGTALNDKVSYTLTLSGQQDNLPKVCKFGATYADDVAYLNALV